MVDVDGRHCQAMFDREPTEEQIEAFRNLVRSITLPELTPEQVDRQDELTRKRRARNARILAEATEQTPERSPLPRQLVATVERRQAWCDPHGNVGPLRITEEQAAQDLRWHNEREHRAVEGAGNSAQNDEGASS
jgi:hypothetical protein